MRLQRRLLTLNLVSKIIEHWRREDDADLSYFRMAAEQGWHLLDGQVSEVREGAAWHCYRFDTHEPDDSE